MKVETEELLEEYNKLQEKLVGIRDTIKVRLAEEKRIEEENCADNHPSFNPSNAEANFNTIHVNNDDTLYYTKKSRVGEAHFDSTGGRFFS